MGRLVDIDRLCDDLVKRWSIADKKKEDTIRAVMADVVTPIVVSQPTVDAVPVVRCRDCEYWDTIPRSTVAPLHHQCKETRLMTTGTWYCPLGKRKDGNSNGL